MSASIAHFDVLSLYYFHQLQHRTVEHVVPVTILRCTAMWTPHAQLPGVAKQLLQPRLQAKWTHFKECSDDGVKESDFDEALYVEGIRLEKEARSA